MPVTKRVPNVILVECLSCKYEGIIHETDLANFGLKPGAPISRFIKRLRCRKCGSGSVMAKRIFSKSAVA